MLAARPAQAVNGGMRLTDAPIPRLPPAELEVACANVVQWGGSLAIFRHFLAAGLTSNSDTDPHQVAAVAAWRAGALGLRLEALRLLPGLPPEVAGAALGFVPAEVAEFTELQQLDPYWWPGRAQAGGQVLRAGGFAGLGHSWLAPPTRAGRGAITGRWVVLAGTWWQLDADVFGAVLSGLTDEPDCGPETDASGVRIRTRRDSYLVELAVPDEAR